MKRVSGRLLAFEEGSRARRQEHCPGRSQHERPMKTIELRRGDTEPPRDESDVSELFAHLFSGLVLASTVAFVLAGAILICL